MSGAEPRRIDDHVAAEIRRLHKRHPKLGHQGLFEALRQAGFPSTQKSSNVL